MSDKPKNALAKLAERLRNGLYINPNDKRFDKPVVCASLDANDVLNAQRIIAELAKVEFLTCDGAIIGTVLTQADRAIIKSREIAEKGVEK